MGSRIDERFESGRQTALTRAVFLRALGVVTLFAFASIWMQMDGLFLSGGILPAEETMENVRLYADAEGLGPLGRFFVRPTLAWLSSSDAMLHGLALVGMAASVMLFVDVAPGLMILLAWLCYLSLVHVGGVFFYFQWDTLLLETLFASLFLAPWRLLRRRGGDRSPTAAGVWLIRLLLFKLMFLAGAVKLMARDDSWTGLKALDVHFFTQPIPTWTAYYAHHLPHAVHAALVALTLVVELVFPFFLFGPKKGRLIFGISTLALMAGIASTGNYGFFNLLTAALAIMCFDDEALRKVLPARWRGLRVDDERRRSPASTYGLTAAVAVLVGLSALKGYHRLDRTSTLGDAVLSPLEPFMVVNPYGLFQDMTLSRPEIVVEGSRDGVTWAAYELKYKPGDMARRPVFIGPHMPRLDWQMWFAALQGCQRARWFQRFAWRLMDGAPDVRDLIAHDPFVDEPPRYLRTTLYDYAFTELGEAGWWTRERPRQFCPVFEAR